MTFSAIESAESALLAEQDTLVMENQDLINAQRALTDRLQLNDIADDRGAIHSRLQEIWSELEYLDEEKMCLQYNCAFADEDFVQFAAWSDFLNSCCDNFEGGFDLGVKYIETDSDVRWKKDRDVDWKAEQETVEFLKKHRDEYLAAVRLTREQYGCARPVEVAA